MTGTDDKALRDRARGALLGLAVGDALGTTLEFKPKDSWSRRIGRPQGKVSSNSSAMVSLVLRPLISGPCIPSSEAAPMGSRRVNAANQG